MATDQTIKKVTVLTLGCSKNLVDSESLISKLEKSRIKVTENINEAEAVIVNTCGFIESAKEESLNLIFEMTELKRRKKIKKLIVFGCLSQRYPDSLKNQIPNLDEVYGVNSYEQIITALGAKYKDSNKRKLLTDRHYAYLKIAEGCSHRCSFCAIPLIRGNYVSRTIEDILAEAEQLAKMDVKEINVIAQDSTFYGRDIYGKSELATLLSRLSDIKDFKWIRLLYTYPNSFPMEIVELMAERDNICNYLDIPLQHISDPILKSMKRNIKEDEIRGLLSDIKSIVPNIALRTTFIVGYPNETEEDFNKLLEFAEEIKFDRMGAFIYSPEDGTPAFALGDPISYEEKHRRLDKIMSLQQRISLEKNKKMIGKNIDVIIDKPNGNTFIGRTRYDAPDIDNGVIVKTKKKLHAGSIIRATVVEAEEYDIHVQHPPLFFQKSE